MSLRTTAWMRALLLLPAVALIAAGCSHKSPTAAGSPSAMPSESMMSPMPSESMMSPMPSGSGGMMMEPGAENWHVSITSPSNGFTLTGNTLDLGVQATGYKLSCDWAGKPDQPGIGHYHVLLDKALVNMFCTPTAHISMQNVSPGMHTLTVVPAQDDHTEVEMNAQSIMVDYKPSTPLAPITAAPAGTPSIQILSPKNGATLSGRFTVRVKISDFHPTCALMGKLDVTGYGHWHANVDSMSGPMMGMGTMLGMSCQSTFTATTQGITPGTHTIFALLTDNQHAPTGVFSKVTVHVTG
jgi:hypothetical protein